MLGMLSIAVGLNRACQDEHMNQMIRQVTYKAPTCCMTYDDFVLSVSPSIACLGNLNLPPQGYFRQLWAASAIGRGLGQLTTQPCSGSLQLRIRVRLHEFSSCRLRHACEEEMWLARHSVTAERILGARTTVGYQVGPDDG